MKEIATDELTDVVWVDPERMGGMACFKGTRVPIETLFDYLAEGQSAQDFSEGFPGVEPQQIRKLLEWCKWEACRRTGALDTFDR